MLIDPWGTYLTIYEAEHFLKASELDLVRLTKWRYFYYRGFANVQGPNAAHEHAFVNGILSYVDNDENSTADKRMNSLLRTWPERSGAEIAQCITKFEIDMALFVNGEEELGWFGRTVTPSATLTFNPHVGVRELSKINSKYKFIASDLDEVVSEWVFSEVGHAGANLEYVARERLLEGGILELNHSANLRDLDNPSLSQPSKMDGSESNVGAPSDSVAEVVGPSSREVSNLLRTIGALVLLLVEKSGPIAKKGELPNKSAIAEKINEQLSAYDLPVRGQSMSNLSLKIEEALSLLEDEGAPFEKEKPR